MAEIEQTPLIESVESRAGWFRRCARTVMMAGGLTVAATLAAGTLSACMEGIYGSDMPARIYSPGHELDYIPGQDELVIGNWNTHQGEDVDEQPNLIEQMELLVQQRTDIIALTEVREDHLPIIRKYFPTSYVIYAPAGLDTDIRPRIPQLDPSDWGFAENKSVPIGNALIVRSTLVDDDIVATSRSLSRPSTSFGKKVITEVAFGNKQIYLTHIDWKSGADLQQAMEASEFIAERRDPEKETMLFGDLNDEEGSNVINTFISVTGLVPVKCVGSTLVNYNARIDYMMQEPGNGKPVECDIEESDDSDHYLQTYTTKEELPPGVTKELQKQPA